MLNMTGFVCCRYKDGQVGLRWRTEPEVVTGKGHFICGAKGCDETHKLSSYEVNFMYEEARQQKQVLQILYALAKQGGRQHW